MTAAQIAEAQRLARDWKPKTQAARLRQEVPELFEAEAVPGFTAAEIETLRRAQKRGLLSREQKQEIVRRSKEAVRDVQLNLATLGYKPGPADGILGSRTRSAIEAFQRDHGLAATGEVSNEIKILLLQEMARQKAGLAPTKVELSD